MNNELIVSQIDDADYVLIGPGSPTYAVATMRGSLLYKGLLMLIKTGASLGIASSAAIAFSSYALPVYEIYKFGEPLHWLRGLNFYKHVYKEMTVIPHFNNTEGGRKTDTSRCFMGKDRFGMLLNLLPEVHTVCGIDELTGVIIENGKKEYEVLGKGKLHILREMKA